MFGNLAAYFVLPHVSKALLFAVFTSVGAAGAASLLFLRRIAAYDQQPAYLAVGNDDEEKARRQETIELVPPGKPIVRSPTIMCAVSVVLMLVGMVSPREELWGYGGGCGTVPGWCTARSGWTCWCSSPIRAFSC